jgi:hypothetical protein
MKRIDTENARIIKKIVDAKPSSYLTKFELDKHYNE